MNKLLTTAIALGAIFTFQMNQPLSAHGGGHGHGGHGGHYGHYGHYGHHGHYGHGYGYGYGRGWGYGVGAVGVGIGLGGIGAAVYDDTYVPATSCYDSFGNYICYSY